MWSHATTPIASLEDGETFAMQSPYNVNSIFGYFREVQITLKGEDSSFLYAHERIPPFRVQWLKDTSEIDPRLLSELKKQLNWQARFSTWSETLTVPQHYPGLNRKDLSNPAKIQEAEFTQFYDTEWEYLSVLNRMENECVRIIALYHKNMAGFDVDEFRWI